MIVTEKDYKGLDIKINWEEVEVCNKTYKGEDAKIYLEHLPRHIKHARPNAIDWKESIGYAVPFLYGDFESFVVIQDYLVESKKLVVDIVGYHKINFETTPTALKRCGLGSLINNVYANPNHKYRQLIIDAVGTREAKKLTLSCRKKIELACPHCGHKRNILINTLTYYGFTCPQCSDGYSYPEKLMTNVLNKLRVEYTRQLTYSGGKHKYDFYLPQHKAIFEVHGEQHYKQSNRRDARSLEEEQANDKLKREIAISNGILNNDYHEIDCRYSTLEWCRINMEKALSKYIDISVLTDADWLNMDKRCQKSLVIEVCEYYNKNGGTPEGIAKVFDLSRTTVWEYLKRGRELNLCQYGAKENRTVAIKDGVVVFEAKNYKEMMGLIGGNINYISQCCKYYSNPAECMRQNKKIIKSVGKYICIHKEDYERYAHVSNLLWGVAV